MKPLLVVLLLSVSLATGQDNKSTGTEGNSKPANGQVKVQGCVSRLNGDYILMKEDPAVTYELQATGKTKLHNYLGRYVEVTGQESPTLATSSDTMTRTNASSVTITVSSIRTLQKECSAR